MEMQRAVGPGTFDISLCDIDECSKRLSHSVALCFSSLPAHGHRGGRDHAGPCAAGPHPGTPRQGELGCS